MPRITTASVFVDDQAKALAFYTDVLGFQPKTDVPLGEFRWLTVVSDTDPDGTELLLEPDDHPAAKGATVTQPPTQMGPVTTLIVDDTCGNLIQLATPPRT